MATKTVDVMQSPGIVRNLPMQRIADGGFSEGKNVFFGQNGAEGFTGDLDTFSAASITPLWLQYFPPLASPRWVYADLNEVWVYEGSSHTEITRVSGDYSGLDAERWQATILNGVGVLNNTVDLPQAWTVFEPGTPLVDLPNWDTNRRAKSIRSFKNYLVALNLTDSGVNKPYRVLWSHSADAGTLPDSWDSTDPAKDAREFDLAQTDDHLVDSVPLGDMNIVYKENSTWGMAFIGPPNYFRFWKILTGRGLLHRDCVVSMPRGHVVVTQDDIILHAGQIEQAQSIVDRQMRKWLFTNIDPTNFRNSFIFAFNRKNEIWFCFPEVGETYANSAVVWNWRDSSIGVRELTSTPFASMGPVGDSIIEDLTWG